MANELLPTEAPGVPAAPLPVEQTFPTAPEQVHGAGNHVPTMPATQEAPRQDSPAQAPMPVK